MSKYPEALEHATISGYEIYDDQQSKVISNMQKWVKGLQEGKFGNLILVGNMGTGKSYLAVCVAKFYTTLVKTRASTLPYPIYVNADDAVLNIQETYRSNESTKAIIDRYKKTSLLILDELGLGSKSDFSVTKLTQIINHRCDNRLPTVVCSNLEVKEFEHYIDARAVERLTDGYSFTLGFRWASFRKTGRDNTKTK